MRHGAGGETVDCGAMCLPGLAERVHSLVQDAAAAGARIMAGGALPEPGATSGQFYPPTVVADVTPAMRLFREEAFGPVMTICRAVRAPRLLLCRNMQSACDAVLAFNKSSWCAPLRFCVCMT